MAAASAANPYRRSIRLRRWLTFDDTPAKAYFGAASVPASASGTHCRDAYPNKMNCARVFRSTGEIAVLLLAKVSRAASAARPNEAPLRACFRKYWQIRSALAFEVEGP